MDGFYRSPLDGPAERRPLPPSIQQISINDDALWNDLCDADEWMPLSAALAGLMRLVGSPQSILSSSIDRGEWNLAHLSVIFELERLQSLLIARQLSERLQDMTWEEPLSSLLHGLDVAAASAIETGRLLAMEMDRPDVDVVEDDFTVAQSETDDVDDIPEWGGGYAYVLFRRYVAEVQAVLDLREAVCREAYDDDEGPTF